MNEPTKTQYAYSLDEENYHGFYDSREDAVADAFCGDTEESEDATICWTGEIEKPDPCGYIDANVLIEHIQCQDDFSGEWAEDWPQSNRPQVDELTEDFKKVFAAWLDKHELHPRFYNIAAGTTQRHTKELSKEGGAK